MYPYNTYICPRAYNSALHEPSHTKKYVRNITKDHLHLMLIIWAKFHCNPSKTMTVACFTLFATKNLPTVGNSYIPLPSLWVYNKNDFWKHLCIKEASEFHPNKSNEAVFAIPMAHSYISGIKSCCRLS